jgi:hypothetical protein
LRGARRRALERGESALWARFEPERDLGLDLQADRLQVILTQPEASGNRPSGWSVIDPYRRPRLGLEGLEVDDGKGAFGLVESGGAVELRVALDRLRWKGAEGELWPPALAEFAVSTSRLAAAVWDPHLGDQGLVLADLALIRAQGRFLREGAPGLFFGGNEARALEGRDDLVWERPLQCPFRELRESPDRLGIRLVVRVYESFGFRRDELPEYLRGERLVFPGR